jgi:hypothetical protein
VFEAMLANAVRICEASFANLLLYDGDGHVALHNAPRTWAAEHQRDPVAPRRLARFLYRVADTRRSSTLPTSLSKILMSRSLNSPAGRSDPSDCASALPVTIRPPFSGREGRDSTLDLAGVAYVDRTYLHADRRGPRLDCAELASPRGDGGIAEDRRACHARCELLEQFQPFPAQAIFELNESSCIAARSRQAINEPGADRVGDNHKHDGHDAGRL